jgi:DnaJ-class molecular chaperone
MLTPAPRREKQQTDRPTPPIQKEMHMSTDQRDLNPGDEAAPGTPGTGEVVCDECHGSGKKDGMPCAKCGGNGKLVKGVGGA